jgi:hypothetical protein
VFHHRRLLAVIAAQGQRCTPQRGGQSAGDSFLFRSKKRLRVATMQSMVEPNPMLPERAEATRLARGVCRALVELGYGVLTEFPLRSGRRVDVIGINDRGETLIVEIKSSIEDFRADQKWGDYLEFCDGFFFAVPAGFPQELIPAPCGLMVADEYGAVILRRGPTPPMNGSRRRAQTARLAVIASLRLHRLLDRPL